jgi:hypothetical protein
VLPSAVVLPGQKLAHRFDRFFGPGEISPYLLRIISLHLRQIKQIGQCFQYVAAFALDCQWKLFRRHAVNPEVKSCAQQYVQVLIDGQMAGQDASNLLHGINEFRGFFKASE